MKSSWIILIAISIFLIITYLYWKVTKDYAQKEYGKKMFKQWSTRTYYWSGALLISGAITVALIYLLKLINVLTF